MRRNFKSIRVVNRSGQKTECDNAKLTEIAVWISEKVILVRKGRSQKCFMCETVAVKTEQLLKTSLRKGMCAEDALE